MDKGITVILPEGEVKKKPGEITWKRVVLIGLKAIATYSKTKIGEIGLRDLKDRYSKK